MERQKLRKRLGQLIGCQIISCLSLFILTACATTPFVDTPQANVEKAITLHTKVSQTFVAHHAGLAAIDLYLAPQKPVSSTITLRLEQSALTPIELATVQVQAGLVTQPKFYRFQFKPIQESNGRLYNITLEGDDVAIGVAANDAYLDGTLLVDGETQSGDLAFRVVYDKGAIGLDLFWFALQVVAYLALAFVLYILPGYLLLGWFWRGSPLTWLEQIGLGASLTIAIYPLLSLWAYVVGLPIGRLLAWLPGSVSLILWLWLARKTLVDWHKIKNWPRQWLGSRSDLLFNSLWLFCLVLLVSVRFVPIHSLNVPNWGDSVHHTLIVQLILDHGGLFQSWEPYAPLRSFTYHFGFHVLIANWAWVSGMGAVEAVLLGGQLLNLLAILTIYPLAMRLAGGNRWAGLSAVVIAGLLSQMPAFYVNWGRYTQLTAQIILPGLLWAFDLWWTEKRSVSPFLISAIACLAAGMLLVHYRIAAIGATAGIAWPLWALWLQRGNLREWWQRVRYMAIAVVCVAVLVAPWAIIVRSGHLPALANTIAQQGANPEIAGGDLVAWSSASAYYTQPLWVAALILALVGLWRRPQLAMPLGLWAIFAFLATNPYLLHLPGSGLVNNFTLVIGAYLPIALLTGWLCGSIVRALERTTSGALLSVVVLSSLIAYGAWQQLHIIDPFYQMVTPADQVAFDWINHNTPIQSRFLVNGFLAYHNSVVVGSDAGWWLPFYTRRENTVPPILYTIEQLQPTQKPGQFRQLVRDLQAIEQNPTQLRAILCAAVITHVYNGQRNGKVGVGAAPLVPIEWLQHNRDFQLLYQEGNAQVWAFDRAHCS